METLDRTQLLAALEPLDVPTARGLVLLGLEPRVLRDLTAVDGPVAWSMHWVRRRLSYLLDQRASDDPISRSDPTFRWLRWGSQAPPWWLGMPLRLRLDREAAACLALGAHEVLREDPRLKGWSFWIRNGKGMLPWRRPLHLGFVGEAEGSFAPMRRASPPRADVLVVDGSPTEALRAIAESEYRSVGLLVAIGRIEHPDEWFSALRTVVDTDGLVLLPEGDRDDMLDALWNELAHEPSIDVAIRRATQGRALVWLSDTLLAAGDLYAERAAVRSWKAS